jgi:hypothetical protein
LKVVLKRVNFGINCVTTDGVGDGVTIIREVSIVAYGLGVTEGDGVLAGFGEFVVTGVALTPGLGATLT